VNVDIVIPTSGRPSLSRVLAALAGAPSVVLVDDRPRPDGPLAGAGGVRVVRGPARGPAAARNAGWRAGSAPWVAFLDDDVEPGDDWLAALHADLAAAEDDVDGVQGRIVVPLPADRRPTDWERATQGLERARWATADIAYRRSALERVGGFDERFPRAYREDADLGLRVTASGGRIVLGARGVRHPVRPAPATVSLAKQAGNADDVLMRALHGRGWRERADVPAGRRPRHLAVTAAGAGALAALAAGRRRTAAAAGAAWLAGTAELAAARIAPGPRTPREIALMTATSAALPAAATAWWLVGLATLRRRLGTGTPSGAVPTLPPRPAARPAAVARPVLGAASRERPERPAAILFDRDGTLVADVPYNGDPARVRPVPGAAAALARLRAAGVPSGVVSNQSGIARGLLTEAQVRAVNARIEALLGPLGPWAWCPHAPGDGCDCRKPAPGLIHDVAARLGVEPGACVVIGDIGADVEAARAAGARGILVPTPRTRRAEVDAADEVARDLEAAVERALEVPA
jgi:histidinol-phosphate phosphatase family protein